MSDDKIIMGSLGDEGEEEEMEMDNKEESGEDGGEMENKGDGGEGDMENKIDEGGLEGAAHKEEDKPKEESNFNFIIY